jgi:hypothetical protein
MTAPFPLGRILATPGALEAIRAVGGDLLHLLSRHASGDWGDLDAHDRRENGRALKNGRRLLSAYPVGEGRVWVITEADRSVTTILLPEEY